MRILTPTVEDVDRLSALASELFPLTAPPGFPREILDLHIATSLTPDAFGGYLARPTTTVLVAVEGETWLGYTMLLAEPPTDPDVLAVLQHSPSVELSKCYVRASHHGAGVAQALVTELLDVALTTGAASVWLGVDVAQARGQAFYRRNGFEVVGTKGFPIGDDVYTNAVMERAL